MRGVRGVGCVRCGCVCAGGVGVVRCGCVVSVGVRAVWERGVAWLWSDLAQVAVECVEVLPVEALGEGGRVAVETMPDEPARVEPVHHRVTWLGLGLGLGVGEQADLT